VVLQLLPWFVVATKWLASTIVYRRKNLHLCNVQREKSILWLPPYFLQITWKKMELSHSCQPATALRQSRPSYLSLVQIVAARLWVKSLAT
jgi:hypothetical protein